MLLSAGHELNIQTLNQYTLLPDIEMHVLDKIHYFRGYFCQSKIDGFLTSVFKFLLEMPFSDLCECIVTHTYGIASIQSAAILE